MPRPRQPFTDEPGRDDILAEILPISVAASLFPNVIPPPIPSRSRRGLCRDLDAVKVKHMALLGGLGFCRYKIA